MNRFAASILAIGLTTTIGTASAQTSGPYSQYPAANEGTPSSDAPYYDYARVIRVDPVLQTRYRTSPTSSQNCYSENGYYTDRDNGGYDDRYPDSRDDRYRDDRYRDDRSRSSNDGHGTTAGRNVATILGTVVGAALGSKLGGGNARYATAAIGSTVGGMAGRGIYESAKRNQQAKTTSVTVCDPVPAGRDGRYAPTNNEVTAYDVTYEFAGRQFVTRTDYHPGDRIRVRVDVRPE